MLSFLLRKSVLEDNLGPEMFISIAAAIVVYNSKRSRIESHALPRVGRAWHCVYSEPIPPRRKNSFEPP